MTPDPVIYVPYADEPIDCLRRAVRSATATGYRVCVVDNSVSGGLVVDVPMDGNPLVHAPDAPLTICQTAWWLCRGGRPFFWLHCDGEVLRTDAPDLLRSAAVGNWGVVFGNRDALLARDTFAYFNGPAICAAGALPDVNLPQYYFDIDWFRRVSLAGLSLLDAPADNLFAHHVVGASWKHSRPRDAFRRTFDAHAYYREKWGGPAGAETYRTPWNEPV